MLPDGRWLRRTFAIWTALAWILLVSPVAGMAATQSLRVQAAPNAQAGRPVAISATGEVGLQSTISIYAQLGGSSCASQASGEPSLGAALVDQRTLTPGAFSFTATFTPATAGSYLLCTYLDASTAAATQHQSEAFTIAVAEAPKPPPAPAPAMTPRPKTACVVPSLKRHTLGGARHLLAVANCKLGLIYRPTRRQAGGRTPRLVVVSQNPAAGTKHETGSKIAVRLGIRARRASAKRLSH